MMRFLKKHGGLLYVGALTLVVVLALMLSDEMPRVIESMSNLDARWMLRAALSITVYLLLRAATVQYYLWREGVRISPLNALNVTLIGQFYSAITPSASGGQPLQVLTMRQMGVPVSTATATVSVKFIGFQLAFMLTGGALWVTHIQAVNAQLKGVRYLVVVGYLINAALMVLVALTMRKSRAVERMVEGLVRLGARMRLVRDAEKTAAKALAALEDYRGALKRLVDRPFDALVIFLLSCLQVLFLMGVIVCVYRAFGLSGTSAGDLLTLQLLLFITAAFVPLPGAAGAQEGGFYLFFQGVFPARHILAAMLCWRFFTYYLLLLSGLVGVVANSIRASLAGRRNGDDV